MHIPYLHLLYYRLERNVQLLRTKLTRNRNCWGKYSVIWLAPALRRQLEGILTADCVRRAQCEGESQARTPWCWETLSAECLSQSYSHLEEDGSQVLWDAFTHHWLRQANKFIGDSPVWEFCQQEKEKAKSLSLTSVTKDGFPAALIEDGWQHHRDLTESKASALRGLKELLLTMQLCIWNRQSPLQTLMLSFAPLTSIWHIFAHIKLAHQFLCAMLLGDVIVNNFLSNCLLLPHVAYPCFAYTWKRTSIQNVWSPLLAVWLNMSTTPHTADRQKGSGNSKSQRGKTKCIHLACCFWVASSEVLVFIHVSFMCPAMSLWPSFPTWAVLGLAAETSVFLGGGKQGVHMCICRVGFCTEGHNASDTFKNHPSCK